MLTLLSWQGNDVMEEEDASPTQEDGNREWTITLCSMLFGYVSHLAGCVHTWECIGRKFKRVDFWTSSALFV